MALQDSNKGIWEDLVLEIENINKVMMSLVSETNRITNKIKSYSELTTIGNNSVVLKDDSPMSHITEMINKRQGEYVPTSEFHDALKVYNPDMLTPQKIKAVLELMGYKIKKRNGLRTYDFT